MLVYWRVSVHKENSIVVPCLAWLMDPLLVVTEPLVKTLKVARDDRHIPTDSNLRCRNISQESVDIGSLMNPAMAMADCGEAKEKMMARAKGKRGGTRQQFKPNSHSASSV